MGRMKNESGDKYHFMLDPSVVKTFDEIWLKNEKTKDLHIEYTNQRVLRLIEEFIKSEGQIMQYHDLALKMRNIEKDFAELKEYIKEFKSYQPK